MKFRHYFTWNKKWLYFSENLNEYKLKEERANEDIMYLKEWHTIPGFGWN